MVSWLDLLGRSRDSSDRSSGISDPEEFGRLDSASKAALARAEMEGAAQQA